MKRIQPLNVIFMVVAVAIMLMAVFSVFYIADHYALTAFSRLDAQIEKIIAANRSGFMDKLAPKLADVYFWIPFYGAGILLLAGLERIKFFRISKVLGLSLLVLNMVIVGFNALADPAVITRFGTVEHYTGKALPLGTGFSLSSPVAISFGFALFVFFYLRYRFWPLCISLFVWAGLIGLGELYVGFYYPGALLLSLLAGSVVALACYVVFQHLSANYILKI